MTILEKHVTGALTSGGFGTRQMPLNLSSPTASIPKGSMRALQSTIAEQQVAKLRDAGADEIFMLTVYLDNRLNLANRFGGGDRDGIPINYSEPHLDIGNKGSGDTILTNAHKFHKDGLTVCEANDNLYEYSVNEVVRRFLDAEAHVGIMTVEMPPLATMNQYGLVIANPDTGRITKLEEKPKTPDAVIRIMEVDSLDELAGLTGHVNTAGYIWNNTFMAELAQQQWVAEQRERDENFDMAGVVLRRAIADGYKVQMIQIDNWGDLGTTHDWIRTLPKILAGNFRSVTNMMKRKDYVRLDNNVWIHPEAAKRTYKDGQTLLQRIESGNVKIGPDVYIGKKAIIRDGARIRVSNVEKQSVIESGARLDHTYVAQYCIVGEGAELSHCALGIEARIESSLDNPTVIQGESVVGGQVNVPAGVHLNQSTKVFPAAVLQPGKKYNKRVIKPTQKQVAEFMKQRYK